MVRASPFAASANYRPAESIHYRGARLPARFDEPHAEYRAARKRAAVFDRSDRGLLVICGNDRKPWLHNLVTNAVTTLDDNTGNYAFATDLAGRVLFDLNIISLPQALWLDIDAQSVPAAVAHFERHLLSEDVRLRDAGDAYARLACAGPQAPEVAGRLGAGRPGSMPALSASWLAEPAVCLFRHDVAGLPGFELLVPREAAAAWWDRLVGELGVRPAGFNVLDALRIEAGLPWPGRDIDQRVVAPETGQTGRAISYRKGCYLGQEVIERLRARGALARRLVRLAADDGQGLALPSPLRQAGAAVGRLTSLVRHPLRPRWIGLGYLRTTVRDPTGLNAGDPPRPIRLESP